MKTIKAGKTHNKNQLLIALIMLGQKLKEKGYNKKKLIDFCRQIRKDVYNAQFK